MIAAAAIASIGCFIVAFWLLGVARVGAGVLTVARGAVAAMRDENLDDAAREKAVQRASLQLMGAFASILVRSALALLISFLPIWIASLAGLASIEAVVAFLSRWDVIAVASMAVIAGYVIWTRLAPTR